MYWFPCPLQEPMRTNLRQARHNDRRPTSCCRTWRGMCLRGAWAASVHRIRRGFRRATVALAHACGAPFQFLVPHNTQQHPPRHSTGASALFTLRPSGAENAILKCRPPRAAAAYSATQEADTIRSMRKEEFERRAAEMKARMLAQRNRQAEEPSATSVRKSRTKGQENRRTATQSPEIEVQALQKRVKELEAENLRLRQQLATMANRVPSSQPSTDSVREQQHNFFKYSNVRRY